MSDDEPPKAPLFLSDAEMQRQATNVAWRKGNTDLSGSIFQIPRSTADFPRIFQHAVKREPAKVLPFSYKSVVKMGFKPRVMIPADDDDKDPLYAPRTP